jgi:hypothetical protein
MLASSYEYDQKIAAKYSSGNYAQDELHSSPLLKEDHGITLNSSTTYRILLLYQVYYYHSINVAVFPEIFIFVGCTFHETVISKCPTGPLLCKSGLQGN